MTIRPFILSAALLAACLAAAGQSTKVRGRVTDLSTGEPVPLVSITLPGTQAAATTDFEGNYYIETREKAAEIVATHLSYEKQSATLTPGAFNTVDFALRPAANALEGIVITLGENPAHRILRQVSAHKKRNNPDYYPSYRCKTYTKMELDLGNMKPSFRSRTMQRNFGFVFSYMDTSAVTGKAYLPVMISEASADYHWRRSPRLSREIVRASRISGIEEDYTFAQFTGHLHVKVNLYDNFIDIFGVSFVSPLNDQGTLYYKYYLADSTSIGGDKEYRIRFRPRGKGYPTFEGEVSIDSATWALSSARIRMAKDLNINWIRDLAYETEQDLAGDSLWFPRYDKIMADFSVTLRDSTKMHSFMGQRQVDYSDVVIGEAVPPDVERLSGDVVMQGDVLRSDEEYWRTVRPHALSQRESDIYTMVEQIRNVPLFRTFYDVMNTFVFGYVPTGKYFEVGPYYKLYSYNDYEKNRFQLGGRTTSDLSKRIRLTAYGAYGTGDQQFKGSGEVEYMFSALPISKLDFYARRDVQQLGASPNAFTTGNILSTIFARGNTGRMTMIEQAGAWWEREWTAGFFTRTGFDYRRMLPNPVVDFITPSGERLSHINAAELTLGGRVTRNEIVVRDHFGWSSVNITHPVFGLRLAGGMRGVMDCDYDYMRAEGDVRIVHNINPIGWSNLILTAGAISGKLPYPLLKLHEGNSTYFYDPMAFSCMNYYEFASDRWASVLWEHHFSGFFLNKIPGLRKLRIREVATVKALWGSLTERNDGSLASTDAVLLFPEGMSAVGKPYVEAGVGLENILRVFRVDAIWRLTHREGRERVDNFAVNLSFGIAF